VLRRLLCALIPAPDPNSFPPNAIQPPAFDAGKTGRVRWTEKTGAPACAACHSRINSFGYALEGYDPIGRFRDKEIIYTPGTDKVASQLPVDSAVDLTWPDGTTARVADGVELGAALADAGASCFGRQWLRFGFGRMEAPEDACFVEELGGLASTGDGIAGMFRRAAVAPANRMRRVAP